MKCAKVMYSSSDSSQIAADGLKKLLFVFPTNKLAPSNVSAVDMYIYRTTTDGLENSGDINSISHHCQHICGHAVYCSVGAVNGDALWDMGFGAVTSVDVICRNLFSYHAGIQESRMFTGLYDCIPMKASRISLRSGCN